MTMTLIPTTTLQILLDRLPMPYEAQRDEPLYEAIVEAEKLIKQPVRPTVVCNITGGVLQGSSSDYPVDVICLDFDTDSCDDHLIELDGSDCYAYESGSSIDPTFVEQVLTAISVANRDYD